jgi:uncharacterized protein (TIGR02448 family)
MKKIELKKVFSALVFMLSSGAAIADWEERLVTTYYIGAVSVMITLSPFIFVTQTYDAVRKEFAMKMREARDDAASYIASSGEIRGPYLESALKELREDKQFSSFDEPQLVQAILAFSVY